MATNTFFLAITAARRAAYLFLFGRLLFLALIWDPCPRGLLEFQNLRAAFDLRPVRVKSTFFGASRFWQAPLGLIKPAGMACAQSQN